jgi:hypothetical protein
MRVSLCRLLLQQLAAQQPHDRSVVLEGADHVVAALDDCAAKRTSRCDVQALERVSAPHLAPVLLRDMQEGQHIPCGGVQYRHGRLDCFRSIDEQVAQEVHLAPLPAAALEHVLDRRRQGNGAGVMATLRTAAMNLLRLAGFRSIGADLQAVIHDITALLAMAMRRPELSRR